MQISKETRHDPNVSSRHRAWSTARAVLEVVLVEPDPRRDDRGVQRRCRWSAERRATPNAWRCRSPASIGRPGAVAVRAARRSGRRARRDDLDHGRRAGLDGLDDLALPLRPGVVEHPGRLHRDLGRAGPARRSSSGRTSSKPASRSSTRTSRRPAATPTTSSCWPRSTTSSRTGTRVPSSAPSCAACWPRDASEIMGGTYNEPNTNLTTTETTDPQLRARRSVSSVTCSAATRTPPGSSTSSATTRSSPVWPPRPG